MDSAGEEQRATPLPRKLQLTPSPYSSPNSSRQRGAEPQPGEENNLLRSTHWEAAAAATAGGTKGLRRRPYNSDLWKLSPPIPPRRLPPPREINDGLLFEELTPIVPTLRVQNVEFPASSRFDDSTQRMFVSTDTSASQQPSQQNEALNSKNGKFVSTGGVLPQDEMARPPPTLMSEELLFKQSGRHRTNPAARIVHPQGFRILKNRSAVERSLRSYFRLPPAPSQRLEKDRLRTQQQLMAVEMKEDEQEAQFLSSVMDVPLRQTHILLDGYLLLCASGQPEPEAVEAATLQCSHLVGVIEDDLTHFKNLRFLDVSENELLLEQLLSLTSLEVLHLPYNKIRSLAGISRIAMEQQLQSTNSSNAYGNRARRRGGRGGGVNSATHDSKSIRSAAAYYAQEKTTTGPHSDSNVRWRSTNIPGASTSSAMFSEDAANKTTGYFSPHKKFAGNPNQASECSLHDVLLPNLHALNLSFNKIPPADILHLSYFPCLEKLDLSGNNLRVLPEDLADLTSVTHFALERNQLRDGNAVFAALSTMPALIEVNLNHNELRHVPPLSVNDGRGLCFPSIEVIGLGYNRFASARDIAALSELVRTLQRVMLAGNPIACKSKERSAAHSLFAQSVMNHYWEQAALRHPDNNEGTSTNHFRPDVTMVDASTMSTPHPYKAETGDGKDMSNSEYHEWDSLVDLWRDSKKGSKSRSSSRTPNKMYENESYDNHADPPSSYTLNTPAVSALPEGESTINNLFWYGDAEPLPSQGTTTKRGDHTLPELPTPSLLRFVELVFEDAVIKKQKPGYFYAKGRQLAMEGGGPQRHMTAGMERALSLVHPQTGLVTVPNYTEFMDIYHILDDPPMTRRGFKRRTYATPQERRRRRKDHIALPKETFVDSAKEEKKTQQQEEAAVPVDQQSTGAEEEYDGNEYLSDENVSSRDVMFMTGVPLQEKQATHVKKPGETVSQETPVEHSSMDIKEEEATAPPLSETTDNAQKKNLRKEKSKTKQKQQQHGQSPRKKKESQPSSMAAEPPSTNVRILMNELRRMLRRPLPSLPPVSTNQSAGRF